MRNVQDITHFPIDGDTTVREDLLQRVPFMQAASLRDQRRNVYANEISEQTTCMNLFRKSTAEICSLCKVNEMRNVDLFRKGTLQTRFFWDSAKVVHFKRKTEVHARIGSASDKNILIYHTFMFLEGAASTVCSAHL